MVSSASPSVSVARRSCELALGLLVLHGLSDLISAQYGDDETFWADTDDFDRIHDKYHAVNEDNCAFKHVQDLKVYFDKSLHSFNTLLYSAFQTDCTL